MSKSKPKNKIKVPKRVAGVKIPKAVRKGPVLQFVNSSAGKMLVAEAITAALGAVALGKSAAGGNLKEGALDARDALKEGASRLTNAFAAGVRAFREALADAPAGSDDDARERAGDTDAPAASKKNSRRSADVNPT